MGAYGEGVKPRLDAGGAVENVVNLTDQEYITLTDLEITNTDPGFDASFELNASNNRSKNLRAVNISATDFGQVRGITLRDLYIHDINGNLAVKWNGGIFFNANTKVVDGELQGRPTYYDGVLVENNRFERVDRSAIKLVGSSWANQSLANNPGVPLNWTPSKNIVVRGNTFLHIGGDSITVRDSDGALIEGNLVRHSRYQNTGYNAGIWPFQASNTVVQHNEVSHTHGVQDGQGLDTDHASSYSVMQYNYSHDNEGGFMLIMNGYPHTAPTIRYNVSQNDADKTFEFSRGTPAGTMIYNNTIHSNSTLVGPRGGVFDLANSKAGTGNREVFIFNNVFSYPAGQTWYVGEAETFKTKVRLFNNAYVGGVSAPAEEGQAITGDLKLPALGSAPSKNGDATAPVTGLTSPDSFAGYLPGEGSALDGAGVSVADAVAKHGGTITDRRALPPVELHELALAGESIDFAAGDKLPDVTGADYAQDFRGTPVPSWFSGEGRIPVGALVPQQAVEPQPDQGGTGDDAGAELPTPPQGEETPAPEVTPTALPEPTPTTEPTTAPTAVPEPVPPPTPGVESPSSRPDDAGQRPYSGQAQDSAGAEKAGSDGKSSASGSGNATSAPKTTARQSRSVKERHLARTGLSSVALSLGTLALASGAALVRRRTSAD